MHAYSMDLRVRVMADVDAGRLTMRAIAAKFRVSTDWIRKLKRMRRATGSFAAGKPAASRKSKFAADLPRIQAFIEQKPDATLREIREELSLPMSISHLDRLARRLRLTFKKRRSCPPSSGARTSRSGDSPGAPSSQAGTSST